MFNRRSVVIAALAVASISVAAQANVSNCERFLADKGTLRHELQMDQVRDLVDSDAYLQWLKWEITENEHQFTWPVTRKTVNIPLVGVMPQEVSFESIENSPVDFLDLFRKEDSLFFPLHPFNQSEAAPFFGRKPVKKVKAHLTASRSLALLSKRGFTIKLATDRPHGKSRAWQPNKVDTKEASALLHTKHIFESDKILKSDSIIRILPDIFSVRDNATGSAALVRDVRDLDDGHYYLPAFSIRYVGRRIAELNGEYFDSFYAKNYAALLGEAKARLLLRYGLQMKTPNSQNFLLQLDRNLKPTGKIFIRDLSDARFVKPIGRAFGLKKEIAADEAVGYETDTNLEPNFSNSIMGFPNGDRGEYIHYRTLNPWKTVHDNAYISFIEKQLGLDLSDLKLTYDQPYDMYTDMPELYKILSSKLGQQKLKEYREKLFR